MTPVEQPDRRRRTVGDLVHGATAPSGFSNGYGNYGCRCDECTAAHAAYVKAARRRRAGQVPLVHGRSTYENWGCRCDECKTAKLESDRTRSQARKSDQ